MLLVWRNLAFSSSSIEILKLDGLADYELVRDGRTGEVIPLLLLALRVRALFAVLRAFVALWLSIVAA